MMLSIDRLRRETIERKALVEKQQLEISELHKEVQTLLSYLRFMRDECPYPLKPGRNYEHEDKLAEIDSLLKSREEDKDDEQKTT